MNSIARTIPGIAGLILAGVLAASVRAQSPPDGLLFRNGDLLYGQLLSIDPQSVVRWRHPDASEPIDFKPESVAQIDFTTPTNSAARSNSTCKLVLANGDSLEGNLVSCDREAVTLQTWYAGRVRIPRPALQSLGFIPHSPAVFTGITGLEGWTQGASPGSLPGETGQWTYRGGAFYANKMASIARDLKLPDVAEIQFDLAWKGGLNLAVALYTDSLQPVLLNAREKAPNFGGFYSFRLQNSVVDLWPIKKLEPVRPLGQLFLPSLNNKDRLHVDLRVSKPQHRFSLYLDDLPVKEWIDPVGFIGEGTCLRFVQNPAGAIKLSNLRVTQWDGLFEEQPSTETPDTTNDVLWPEKGPKVVGSIESIANEKITTRTTNGSVEIPLAKIKSIDFARQQAAAPQTEAATVRATFAQGGVLSFILESWRPDEMIIRSPDFGKARLNPAAFTRLQFLLPEKKPAEGPKG